MIFSYSFIFIFSILIQLVGLENNRFILFSFDLYVLATIVNTFINMYNVKLYFLVQLLLLSLVCYIIKIPIKSLFNLNLIMWACLIGFISKSIDKRENKMIISERIIYSIILCFFYIFLILEIFILTIILKIKCYITNVIYNICLEKIYIKFMFQVILKN